MSSCDDWLSVRPVIRLQPSLPVVPTSVDSFRVVVCRHVPTVAGSVLEAQSNRPQASLFSVGTLVPLPALWHFNRAGIGFSQGSCETEARFYPLGNSGTGVENNLGDEPTLPAGWRFVLEAPVPELLHRAIQINRSRGI